MASHTSEAVAYRAAAYDCLDIHVLFGSAVHSDCNSKLESQLVDDEQANKWLHPAAFAASGVIRGMLIRRFKTASILLISLAFAAPAAVWFGFRASRPRTPIPLPLPRLSPIALLLTSTSTTEFTSKNVSSYVDADQLGGRGFVVLDVVEQCNGHRRLGNQLFAIAALVAASRVARLRAVLPPAGSLGCLAEFDDYVCPSSSVIVRSSSPPLTSASASETLFPQSSSTTGSSPSAVSCLSFVERSAMRYDDRFERIRIAVEDSTNDGVRCVVLAGYFQSWRYAAIAVDDVRRAIRFADDVRQAAVEFHSRLTAGDASDDGSAAVRVGVHVRRGDMTWQANIAKGYRPPGRMFYRRAMDYFAQRHRDVLFVVCTDDVTWARKVVDRVVDEMRTTNESTSVPAVSRRINVTYCDGQSAGHDLVVLSMCDHVIVSAGSFGWWAAWLANGTTVYCDSWPRNGTQLADMYERTDYYPPYWIPVSC